MHAISLHLKQSHDLRVHLVLEENLNAPEDLIYLESPIFSSMRHLVVSAPSGLNKPLSLTFLHPCTSLTSLDFKDLSSVKTAGWAFKDTCPRLRFFDPRGVKAAVGFSTPYIEKTSHEMGLADTIQHPQKTVEQNKKNGITFSDKPGYSQLIRLSSTLGHYDKLLPEPAGPGSHANFTPPAIRSPHIPAFPSYYTHEGNALSGNEPRPKSPEAPISRESFNKHWASFNQHLASSLFPSKPAATEKSVLKETDPRPSTSAPLENEDDSQACDWGFLWKDKSVDLWQQPSNAFWNQTWETFCQTSKVF
ncbi:MAG: hypothetical protein H2057_05965 [Alphaproteobacteria bacterium]|nr:hypothetical protein [Alphaproteobacteria bacterium]